MVAKVDFNSLKDSSNNYTNRAVYTLSKKQLIGLSGEIYSIANKPLGSGGEGDIYAVMGDRSRVIKIYHPDRVTSELQKKLVYMSENLPSSDVLNQVAWPIDVVYDAEKCFKGFVMPRLDIDIELGDVYVYPQTDPEYRISYKNKLIIAMNICTIIKEVHDAGYVFGDFNPRNIGINMQTGKVAFLDTDSYHIVLDEKVNKAFRCKVCLDGYVAPELLKQCEPYKKDAYENAPLPTFTKDTDNFALAIHIFKLLMNGYTPFNGIKENETVSMSSPGVGNQAIKRDSYCFKKGNKPQAVAVPPMDILPRDLQKLFKRAFIIGKNNPQKRPDASEWYTALSKYEDKLVTCNNESLHMYRKGLHSCPWCQADDRYIQLINKPITQREFAPSEVPVAVPANSISGSSQSVHSSSDASTIMGKSREEIANQVASVLYPVSWVLLVLSIAFSSYPLLFRNMGIYTGPHWDKLFFEWCIIFNFISVGLLCFSTKLKDAGFFGIFSGWFWGIFTCLGAATLKYTQLGLNGASASSTWKYFGILLLIALVVLIGSAKLGTIFREGISQSSSDKVEFSVIDILLIVFMMIIDAVGIALLSNFDRFYNYINTYKALSIGIWVLPIVLFIIFAFSRKGNKSVGSWFCATMTLLFECVVLSLAKMSGGIAVILWIVLAIVALLFIEYMGNIGNIVSTISTISLFIIFILGAVIDLSIMGQGVGAVGEGARLWMIAPVAMCVTLSLTGTISEILKKWMLYRKV